MRALRTLPSTAWAHEVVRRYLCSQHKRLAPYSVSAAVEVLGARGELRDDYVRELRAKGFRMEAIV